MDIDQVAQRLAERAKTIDGIRVTTDHVPDAVTVPHFYVGEIVEDFDQTFGGMVTATYQCRVLVGRNPARESQRQLRTFMRRSGPTSVKAALEGTPGVPQTLDGACQDLHVVRMQGHRLYRVGENAYYGAEWLVQVIGTDSAEE